MNAPAGRLLPLRMLERLEATYSSCSDCTLSRGRTRVVMGSGPVPARLLLVGEGPGKDEDTRGIPFVGAAGKLLASVTRAVGFDLRTDCYVTNIVACRPPDNRVPMPDEVWACRPRLDALFHIVAPRVVLILGGVAMMSLTGKQGITSKRGKWTDIDWAWDGAKMQLKALPTFHPAGLLPGRLKSDADLAKFQADIRVAWEAANE